MREIECLQCGNYCPNSCERKKKDGELTICNDHPAVTGRPRDAFMCDLTPKDLYQRGIACSAVLANRGLKLTELIADQQAERLPSDQVILTEKFYQKLTANPLLG